MSWEIDANLAEILRLSRQIEAMPPGPPRAELEAEREERRERARRLADASRSVANLEAELANVEKQLAGLGEAPIKPALNESYKLVTDPSAYRRRINQQIEDNEAERRAALELRRRELREALGTAGDQDEAGR